MEIRQVMEVTEVTEVMELSHEKANGGNTCSETGAMQHSQAQQRNLLLLRQHSTQQQLQQQQQQQQEQIQQYDAPYETHHRSNNALPLPPLSPLTPTFSPPLLSPLTPTSFPPPPLSPLTPTSFPPPRRRFSRRAQSCSTPPEDPVPPRQLNAPTSATSVTSSRTDTSVTSSRTAPPSRSSHRSELRLSPATLEAARLAVAARAAYAKHRPSRAIEKAAFLIVTSRGEQRLEGHEVEELLRRGSQRSWHRRHRRRHGSRQSVDAGTEGGGDGSEDMGGLDASTPVSPGSTTPLGRRDSGGGRSPLPSASSVKQNSPKRAPRIKRFSSSVSSADAVSVRSGGDAGAGVVVAPHAAKEHFQKVRFHSFSRDDDAVGSALDVKSVKSEHALPQIDTSGVSKDPKGDAQRLSKFVHDAAIDRPSVLKLAVAGVVVLAGTGAFFVSYLLGRGEAWTLAGSTVMGVGSLLLVLGVCWYLASTTADGGEGRGRLEIRVVDDSQLARLVKEGACVQTVAVQA